jgi:dephospho-CoA kinase
MQNQQKVIAVIGLPGSGKSEVIEYLMETRGWPKVYFGEVTFDEVRRRGLEISEPNERLVREGLRAEFGPLVYSERVIEKIKALSNESCVLVESLYSWEEYLRFREVFGDAFKTIAAHASPTIRYARLAKRPQRPLSSEEARSRDYSQIENLHQAGPIAMADFLIVNEGTREDLAKQVNVAMQSL